jgi:hypothetical protein
MGDISEIERLVLDEKGLASEIEAGEDAFFFWVT